MPSKKSSQKLKQFQSVKGMHDVLPKDAPAWDRVQKVTREITDFYNFLPITTPLVEPLELYLRTTGESSEIVEKQMFSVKTKGGDLLALRPEFTPGIARAYIQHGLSHLASPLKLFAFGPLFRHEQPQAGRFRQLHQIDFEIIGGENDPIFDAQIILATYRIIEELKIKNIRIELNTIGCRVCRPAYKKQLVSYYKLKEKQLCGDCRRRLPINPLRLLDCKNESCLKLKEDAPIILDSLCGICKSHFKSVLEYLEDLKLPYTLNHHLVRGLDYYTKTVFELFTEAGEGEGELDFALAGGGRYDYLIEELGGRPTPAVGVALGVERLIEIMNRRNLVSNGRLKDKIFFIHIGELAKKKSLALIEQLKEAHLPVLESLGKESLDAQFKAANKAGSPLAIIFGQKEAYEESVIVRDMKTGAQETVPIPKMAAHIKRRLNQ